MVEVKNDVPRRSGWPEGHKFGQVCRCKEQTGKERLKYIQPERALSYKPRKFYRPPDVKMPEGTTYKMSYESFDPGMVQSCRGVPTVTKENLLPYGEFSGDTTHKMSYGAWPGLKKPNQCYPRDHKLRGEGPMQEVTTHRHDYTAKPIESVTKIIAPPCLGLSCAPMEGDSIMSMSYKCPDYQMVEPVVNYKPRKRYLPPESPVEVYTTQKLSYLPWQVPPKEETPWSKKDEYRPPQTPLDTGTIYSGSFMAPGKIVEDPSGHCVGCYCLYPGECFDTQGNLPKAEICPPTFNPNDHSAGHPPPRRFTSINYKEFISDLSHML